jgi:opacity protein-like surface antigen
MRNRYTLATIVAVMAMAVLSSSAVYADHLQNTKNFWRNGALAAGLVTLYGLHNHQNTTMWLGAAGTGYSLYQYERARHEQSQRSAWRARYHRMMAERYYHRRLAERYYHRHHRYHHYRHYR